MSHDDNHSGNEPDAIKQQSNETTEANKPDDARVKGNPKAGNILGGVLPKK